MVRRNLRNILLLAALTVYRNNLILLRRKRTLWTKLIRSEKEREKHGFYNKVFKVLKNTNDEEFKKITRMNISQFDLLSNLLEEKLSKWSQRKPIIPECRLAMTLMFLSQGINFRSLSYIFRTGVSTAREIVLETCDIIWDELHKIYVSSPNEEEWKRIAVDFFNMTGMPNCVGAIDGKHIRIKCPPNAGSLYYNYKKYHSIVLLAACDSSYCFTAIDIGAYGSQSDGGIFNASSFGRKVLDGKINFPPSDYLPNSNIKCPYFLVADAAFPLKTNIMRPYAGMLLSEDKEKYNKILSKARGRIENAFGIMTMRWRILLNVINCNPENAIRIVKAVVALHNFVKMNDGEYCPPDYVDRYNGDERIDGLWRKNVMALQQTRLFTRFNAPRNAFEIRETLKEYIFTSTKNN